MSTSITTELAATGFADVVVLLKPAMAAVAGGAAAASAALNLAGLKSHFIKPPSRQSAALTAARRSAGLTTTTLSAAAAAGRLTAESIPDKSPPVMHLYPNLGVAYGSVDKKGYNGLKADKKRVKAVVPAPRLRLIRPISAAAAGVPSQTTWGINFMRVPDLWAQGLTGAGVLIGHLDTGVDGTHPNVRPALSAFAFFDNFGNRTDLTPNQAIDTDQLSGGHGTHTAGTIAGRPINNVGIGVAPGALLASASVIERTDVTASVLGGMDWAIDQGVRIMSMSLGLANFGAFIPLAQQLRSLGILPIMAVGNEGPNTSRMPGNQPEALSVGAMNKNGGVPLFSSSQRFLRPDDPIVPDLVAPGEEVHSALIGGGFGIMKGSSMATPHVAGLAALLMEAHPTKTIDEIEAAIFASCQRTQSMPVGRANRGCPDAVRALNAL